jgi:hypothetical protein
VALKLDRRYFARFAGSNVRVASDGSLTVLP